MPNAMHLHRRLLLSLFAACLGVAPSLAGAQQDKNAERAARRLQMQNQALQQQVQEAQAAKSKADADTAVADKLLAQQAQAIPRTLGALRQANESLKLLQASRDGLTSRLAALEKQAAEQKRVADDVLATRERELAQSIKLRDAQFVQWQGRHDEQLKQGLECSDKNQRLVQLSADLLDRYRKKSVAETLKQRDPLLGLGDVEMFNLVQEYRDKADAERFSPSTVNR